MQQEKTSPQSDPSTRIPQQKQSKQPLTKSEYIPIATKIQAKIRRIFREFSFSTITFHLFLLNCITWFSVHLVYYFSRLKEWDCVQFAFFAKFQPSITYQFQIWRLLLSSLMFRGWIQFYFNNFALNMLGYVIEKQSKMKFLFIFYGSILAGHMLSCCLSNPSQLTVGTSCGTMGLLPIQISRYIKLRRSNPIQATGRRNFLIFNILTNFILNILAIFNLDTVDWVSHIGCIIAGTLFLVFYEMKEMQQSQLNQSQLRRRLTIQIASIVLLIAIYVIMALIIWIYLPYKGKGKEQLETINFLCYSNI